MKRWAFMVIIVFLASVPAAGICVAAPGDGWMEVPFTGTITISRTLAGSAVIKEAEDGGKESGPGKKEWRCSWRKGSGDSQSPDQEGSAAWSGRSWAVISATITGSEPVADEEGNVTGYHPVGYVTGRVTDLEDFRSKHVSITSRYSHSEREEHAFSPGSYSDWCRLTVNLKEGLYNLSFPGICLGAGRGERVTVVVLPDIQREEREPWAGLGPVYVVPPLLDMGMKSGSEVPRGTLQFPYNPESRRIHDSLRYTKPPGGNDEDVKWSMEDFPPEHPRLKEELLSYYSEIARNLANQAGWTLADDTGTWTITWSLDIGNVPVRADPRPVGDNEN